jgi:hypothetical protein
MLQRIALYATLGYLLDALAIGFTHWGFWCILALFWASEHMTRSELIEQLNEELQAMRKRKDMNNEQ